MPIKNLSGTHFSEIITQVKNGQFSPCIVYENDVPAEYAALKLTSYPEANRKDYAEISSLLEDYYAEQKQNHPHPSAFF